MADAAAGISETKELLEVAQNAQDILCKADTVFPFTLFPDTVVIDRVKVTIKRRLFFDAGKVMSIQIEDILNAEATTGPFLGSLKIWTRFFADSNKPIIISKLKNNDVMKLKRILQGFIIARHKKVDCTNIDRYALVNLLEELGKEAVT